MRKIETRRADPNLAAWADSVDAEALFLSVLSLQELEVGVLGMERKDPEQGARMRRWLNHQVLPEFAARILAVDQRVVLAAARLQVPDRRPVMDCLLAATALVYGFVMVTRNRRDFDIPSLTILDPWESVR